MAKVTLVTHHPLVVLELVKLELSFSSQPRVQRKTELTLGLIR